MAEYDGAGVVKIEDSRATSKEAEGSIGYVELEEEQRAVAERIRALEARKWLAEMEEKGHQLKE